MTNTELPPERIAFAAVCEMLPEGANWGDRLTPAIARAIVDSAVAAERERPSANRCWSEPADALGMAALLVSEAKRADRPRAWLCEMVQEDGTTRTQYVAEDPEGLRWNDAGETSPYRTTPLYALTAKQVSLVSGA